jgi:LPPG:FO 2-phospho-L-lactate transferase
VLGALARARAIVIGPSNPVISIGPILALPGMRDGLQRARARVVAVSPVVQGQVLKPATAPLMQWAGHPLSASGVAAYYEGVVDGMVCDGPLHSLPAHETDVLMADAAGRRRLASETLSFALSL